MMLDLSFLFHRSTWTIYGLDEKGKKVPYTINVCDDSQANSADVSVNEDNFKVVSRSFYFEGQFEDNV